MPRRHSARAAPTETGDLRDAKATIRVVHGLRRASERSGAFLWLKLTKYLMNTAEMRSLITLMEARKTGGNRITRSAFIYLEPKPGESDQFAQCGTCFMFMPGKKRCSIFGPDDVVVADASCGLYVHGEPYDEQLIRDAVTPEAAGYVKEQVRCENCTWYKAGKCALFALLNQADSGAFDLEESVKAKACCNGWQG